VALVLAYAYLRTIHTFGYVPDGCIWSGIRVEAVPGTRCSSFEHTIAYWTVYSHTDQIEHWGWSVALTLAFAYLKTTYIFRYVPTGCIRCGIGVEAVAGTCCISFEHKVDYWKEYSHTGQIEHWGWSVVLTLACIYLRTTYSFRYVPNGCIWRGIGVEAVAGTYCSSFEHQVDDWTEYSHTGQIEHWGGSVALTLPSAYLRTTYSFRYVPNGFIGCGIGVEAVAGTCCSSFEHQVDYWTEYSHTGQIEHWS
jgi:hypothetical protein